MYDIQYDTVTLISKEQVCALCWFRVENLFLIMHGMKNIKCSFPLFAGQMPDCMSVKQ